MAGQVAWNPDREIGEAGDLGTQIRAALANALVEVAGDRHDVVAMRVYIRNDHLDDDTPVQEAFEDFFAPRRLPVVT